jgi:membrane protein DedA with SNARE-associated domain
MDNFILNFIQSIIHGNAVFTYIFFFISAVLQMVFPPFPSDVIIIFEGYLTTLGGSFNFLLVLLNSVMGSIVGSALVYWFGYSKGNEVLRYKVVIKYIDEKHIRRSEKVFHKYGKYGLIISKFIPGTSSLMVLLSGIFRVKKRVYFTYIIVSILLQQVIYMVVGRVIGHNIGRVKKFLSIFNIASVFAILILALFVFIIYKIRKSKSKKEPEREQ